MCDDASSRDAWASWAEQPEHEKSRLALTRVMGAELVGGRLYAVPGWSSIFLAHAGALKEGSPAPRTPFREFSPSLSEEDCSEAERYLSPEQFARYVRELNTRGEGERTPPDVRCRLLVLVSGLFFREDLPS